MSFWDDLLGLSIILIIALWIYAKIKKQSIVDTIKSIVQTLKGIK